MQVPTLRPTQPLSHLSKALIWGLRTERDYGIAHPARLWPQAPPLKAFKLSKDPLFIDKVRGILGLHLNPPRSYARAGTSGSVALAPNTTRTRSNVARAIGTTHTITQPRADVLVVVEDVVGVVRGLHVHQPVVDGVAVRLADPVGVFVAA